MLRAAACFVAAAARRAGGVGVYWWRHTQTGLPPGFAWGNGRLEADEVDIDTKFVGRIAKLFVDEGDMMQPRQVVAMMDTQDLATTLKKDEAFEEAERALDEAKAIWRGGEPRSPSKQALDRTAVLVPKGFATIEQLDQRRQQMAAAVADQEAEIQHVWQVQHPLDAAMHDVELYRVNILDNTLVAPKEGPIEYRVANVGKCCRQAARSLRCSMPLTSTGAGRVALGSDVRIVLDALPLSSRIARSFRPASPRAEEEHGPSGVTLFGAGFGAAKQIALGDDAEHGAVAVGHGKAADAVLQHQPGHVLDCRVGSHSNDKRRHQISRVQCAGSSFAFKLCGNSRLALIRINSVSSQLQQHGREDRGQNVGS